MSQNNPDATLRVPQDSSLADATLRVAPPGTESESAAQKSDAAGGASGAAQGQDATLRVGQDEELVLDAPPLEPIVLRQLPLGVLPPGAVICGDCVVRETIRPHETTRPGLYECDAPEGHVMVKIAAVEFPPREELWEKLPTLKYPSLLRTHRITRERGFYAEVQEFCEGGTLDDLIPRNGKAPLSWETIERGIVASFVAGISYLHANGIVHRDLKPKNLYLRKTGNRVNLVIADFDISSVIESDNTSRDTPRGAGTHFYMAPEAFPRFVDPSAGRAAAIVSPASDFYSFGVVLVELLLGTTALHSGRWSDVYDFYMSGGRLEVPVDLPPRARDLIQGLLIRNRRTRWGIAEVRRWLDHQTTDADLQKIRDDSGFELVRRASRPYNVFPSAPSDIHSLARAMVAEPSLAEEELMAGDVLVNWLGELDAKLAREVRRERERLRRYPRAALLSTIMRLDPTLPFVVSPGYTVASLEEWAEKIDTWVAEKKLSLGLIVSRGTLMQFETWLRLKSDPLPNVADAVADMRAAWWDGRDSSIMSPVDARIAWEEMKWLLDPLRPYEVVPGIAIRTPAELARLCYGTNEDWVDGVPSIYRASLEKWREGWLGAWLRQRARDENGVISPVVAQIEYLRTKDEIAPEATWENVLRMLDPHLPPVMLQLNAGQVQNGIIADWGDIVLRQVYYEAISPGLPYGVWKLDNAPYALTLDPVEINLRRGSLTLRLNTRNGLEVGSAGAARIALEQGGTCALSRTLPVVYRVRMPDRQRKIFMRNGAFIGAGIAGGARLIAFLCTGPEWRPAAGNGQNNAAPANANPANPTNANPANATAEANQWPVDGLPPYGYVGAGTVLLLAAGLAFYVWLQALSNHAQR